MRGAKSSDIVFSLAGHDAEKAFVVLETCDSRVTLVDGKTRKLINPKKKSLKHIRAGKAGNPELEKALRLGTATDKLIRKELAIFRSEVGDKGGNLVCRKTM